MKILITGVNGQVGSALMQQLTEHELLGITREDCDLINLNKVKFIIDQYQPDLIINPASYTKVDQAENESELAFKINRDVPRVIAESAKDYNIPFIHFSTDYVFDGTKKGAYDEDDIPRPCGIYGQSKLAGEKEVLAVNGQNYIFRTSWVYSNIGHNFFLTIKKLSYDQKKLRVVADQIGVPTSNLFIAEQIQNIIPNLNKNNTGIYHLVPSGQCSWYDFAKKIISETNSDFDIKNLYAIKTQEYITKTKRPANSVLANDKARKIFKLKFLDWMEEFKKIVNLNKLL